jgi:hypothetical protein
LVPQFNVLWLDPINPDTFPAGLLDAVAASTAAAGAGAAAGATTSAWSDDKGEERSIEERLREQIRADALQPLVDDDDDALVVASSPKNTDFNSESHLPPKWIDDAAQFLRLNVSEHNLRPVRGCCLTRAPLFFPLLLGNSLITCDKPAERLQRILQYLRAEYHYCFWCGTQYKSSDEMQEECPGPEEDIHD